MAPGWSYSGGEGAEPERGGNVETGNSPRRRAGLGEVLMHSLGERNTEPFLP